MAHVHLTCPPEDQELLWSPEVGLFFSPENMKNRVCTMRLKKFWTSRLILLCHDFIDLSPMFSIIFRRSGKVFQANTGKKLRGKKNQGRNHGTHKFDAKHSTLMKGDLFLSQIMTKSSFYDECFYFVQINSNWFKFSNQIILDPMSLRLKVESIWSKNQNYLIESWFIE